MISICICDDYEKSRAITKKLLSTYASVKVVAEVDSGTALLLMLEKGLQVDIVLLDIAMPDMNGYDVCKRIKQQFPNIKVLGYSGFSKSGAVLKLLLNGAIGFVEKQVNATPLHDAIIDVISAKSIIQNQWVSNYMLKELEKYKNLKSIDTDSKNLIEKEIKILHLLQQGLTFNEVAHALESTEYAIKLSCDGILKSFPPTSSAVNSNVREKQPIFKA